MANVSNRNEVTVDTYCIYLEKTSVKGNYRVLVPTVILAENKTAAEKFALAAELFNCSFSVVKFDEIQKTEKEYLMKGAYNKNITVYDSFNYFNLT